MIARSKVARLNQRHLLRQRRMLLINIVRERIGFGIEVVELLESSIAAFASVT